MSTQYADYGTYGLGLVGLESKAGADTTEAQRRMDAADNKRGNEILRIDPKPTIEDQFDADRFNPPFVEAIFKIKAQNPALKMMTPEEASALGLNQLPCPILFDSKGNGYAIDRFLGMGAQGEARIIWNLKTHLKYVVKILVVVNKEIDYEREIPFLQTTQQYIDHIKYQNKIFLIEEYAKGEEVFSRVKCESRIRTVEKGDLNAWIEEAKAFLRAMIELHQKNIAHCDLAFRNAFSNTLENGEKRITIIDFGHAKNISPSIRFHPFQSHKKKGDPRKKDMKNLGAVSRSSLEFLLPSVRDTALKALVNRMISLFSSLSEGLAPENKKSEAPIHFTSASPEYFIDELMKIQASLHAINEQPSMPLNMASEKKEDIFSLIKREASLDTIMAMIKGDPSLLWQPGSKKKPTPFFYAIELGRESMVAAFIHHYPALLNEHDVEADSPLHAAIGYGHVNVVKLLLKAGADVLEVCNDCTPLRVAASLNDIEMMEVILNHIQAACSIKIYNEQKEEMIRCLIKKMYVESVWRFTKDNKQFNEKRIVDILHDALLQNKKELVSEILQKAGIHMFKEKKLIENVFDMVQEKGERTIEAPQYTLLSLAANRGHVLAVQFLLEKKADPNVSPSVESSPLHRAITGGNVDCIRMLLESGATLEPKIAFDLAIRSSCHNSPLSDIAFNFVSKYPNQVSVDTQTLLNRAVEVDDFKFFEKMKETRSEWFSKFVLANLDQWLLLSVQCGSTKVFKFLFQLKEKENRMENLPNIGMSIVHFAAECNWLEITQYLNEVASLDFMAKDQNSRNPYQAALIAGSSQVAFYLFENGKYDTKENSPEELAADLIDWAAEDNHIAFLRTWYPKLPKINHARLLQSALKNKEGDESSLRFLLEQGIDTNVSFETHRHNEKEKTTPITITALGYAICKGVSYGLMQELIKNAKNGLNTIDSAGLTPLMYAVILGRLDYVTLLLKSGADPDLFSTQEICPIAVCLHYDAAKEAEAPQGDQKFFHALSWAAENHFNAIAEVLLAHNAEPDLCVEDIEGADNNDYWPPINEAIREENVKMVELLLNAGANPNCLDCEDLFENNPSIERLIGNKRLQIELKALQESNTNDFLLQCFDRVVKRIELLADASTDTVDQDNIDQDAINIILEHAPQIVNLKDTNGLTLLMHCIRANASQMKPVGALKVVMNTLLKYKTDLNLTSNRGQTCLQFAIERKQTETIRFLLEQGADVDRVDPYGNSCLQNIILMSQDESLILLAISKSNQINYDNRDRMTAMGLAILTTQSTRIYNAFIPKKGQFKPTLLAHGIPTIVWLWRNYQLKALKQCLEHLSLPNIQFKDYPWLKDFMEELKEFQSMAPNLTPVQNEDFTKLIAHLEKRIQAPSETVLITPQFSAIVNGSAGTPNPTAISLVDLKPA